MRYRIYGRRGDGGLLLTRRLTMTGVRAATVRERRSPHRSLTVAARTFATCGVISVVRRADEDAIHNAWKDDSWEIIAGSRTEALERARGWGIAAELVVNLDGPVPGESESPAEMLLREVIKGARERLVKTIAEASMPTSTYLVNGFRKATGEQVRNHSIDAISEEQAREIAARQDISVGSIRRSTFQRGTLVDEVAPEGEVARRSVADAATFDSNFMSGWKVFLFVVGAVAGGAIMYACCNVAAEKPGEVGTFLIRWLLALFVGPLLLWGIFTHNPYQLQSEGQRGAGLQVLIGCAIGGVACALILPLLASASVSSFGRMPAAEITVGGLIGLMTYGIWPVVRWRAGD